MIRERDLYYRRTFQGAWVISAVVDGCRVELQFMGYTKREASRLFRQTVNRR